MRMETIRSQYSHTRKACYLGYVTQAVVNNFVPLLFLTFQSQYGLPLERITVLVTMNFGIQLGVDLLSARFVDRLGYRKSAMLAHFFAALGLLGLGILPELFPDPYAGLLLSVCFYAIGGGLIEVLISPIVEACPAEKKEAAMSLLHSFYCWGSVFVILFSTGFFAFVGLSHWKQLAFLWALLPIFNLFYFSQVPIAQLTESGEGLSLRQLLSQKLIWLLAVLMLCAGAAEQAMSQWASAFAEAGLGVSKSLGDLAGPCLFSLLMGFSRLLYSRKSHVLPLQRFMAGSCLLCIAGYLLASLSPWPLLSLAGCGLCGFSVGIFWPGTVSLSAARCPKGGTALFALLALFGDLGCSAGPTFVGFLAGAGGWIRQGLLGAAAFPVLLLLGLFLLKAVSGRNNGNVSESPMV